MSCLATALYRSGHKTLKTFEPAFKLRVPNWRKHVDPGTTMNAVYQRGSHGCLKGYESEWPWKNPKKKPFWKQAQKDAKNPKALSWRGK